VFHHHHQEEASGRPAEAPAVTSVRVLQNGDELQAAVERAREFERRRFAESERRVGSYDRYLHEAGDQPSNVVAIDSSAEAS
jgi:hypothetical protein